MASDSILTNVPFWIVIGVIFALAVAYAVCFGCRQNPFKGCGTLAGGCARCSRSAWAYLTCCCPGDEEASEEEPKTDKVANDDDLENALKELKAMSDQLPLLPLKRECAWGKDHLLQRSKTLPTVV